MVFSRSATGPGAREKVWRISEINRMVRELLEQSFYPFWVFGEISNLTIHRSGHVYFTIKDREAQISAVYFRGAAEARRLGLRHGQAIEARGRLTLYEPRGQFQIVVDRLRPGGLGELQRRFEELKQRLQAEGLFDAERKRPIPALPRCVGVITSPQGAAIRDFLQILRRRFADMRVRIYPAAVQGPGAAAEIVAGLRFFNDSPSGCDVLVVTRGGGSLEDLWPFNEESVARAIAASKIPVISAVGHEVDYTISDYVADLRAPTPSAAAELVIARKTELAERIEGARRTLRLLLERHLNALAARFERAAGSRALREPEALVERRQQQVDELGARLARALERREQELRARVALAAARLQALDPRGVLERGYSILVAQDGGVVVTDAAQAPAGSKLRGILARGELGLVVTGEPGQEAGSAPTPA